MYTPFEIELANNMDHMRIPGTEPSSVILSQAKHSNSWKVISKSAKTSQNQNGC